MPANADDTNKKSVSELIDDKIIELDNWKGETLSKVRKLILETSPEIVEEWKWDIPVWSCNGLICTGEVYKNAVNLTFAKGAFLPDPTKLFNSSLEGKVRRAIDLHEGDNLDEKAFKALILATIELNGNKNRVLN